MDTPAPVDMLLESLWLADDTRLQSAVNRLWFRYQALDLAMNQIAQHDGHYEYDPAWIADGEESDAVWLAMAGLTQLLQQRASEPPLPPASPDANGLPVEPDDDDLPF